MNSAKDPLMLVLLKLPLLIVCRQRKQKRTSELEAADRQIEDCMVHTNAKRLVLHQKSAWPEKAKPPWLLILAFVFRSDLAIVPIKRDGYVLI